jgi:hypothetical protein
MSFAIDILTFALISKEPRAGYAGSVVQVPNLASRLIRIVAMRVGNQSVLTIGDLREKGYYSSTLFLIAK